MWEELQQEAVASGYSHGPGGGGDDGDILGLHRDGPGDVEVGGQLPHHHVPAERTLLTIRVDRYRSASTDHPPQDFGTVVVVLHGVLDKAEAVDVTNEGVAVGSQQIEATHRLLEPPPPPQQTKQEKKEQC